MRLAFFVSPLFLLTSYWLYEAKGKEQVDHRDVKFSKVVPSEACSVCHHEHYGTWYITYHRTMTAPANRSNVKAPIEDSLTLEFYGYEVSFFWKDDELYVRLPYRDGNVRTFKVVYTIGSHRMQQFAIQDGDRIYRIPVFYSMHYGRWFHINHAFFIKRKEGFEGFVRGYSIWNPNCIFCHNTKPNPGYDPSTGLFNSKVAEFGISCTECHAPGGLHVEANRNPVRRFLIRLLEKDDPTIVNPSKLDKWRSVQVCGQCHGQRLPNPLQRISQIMTQGDPYDPGEDLFRYYKPLSMEDELPNYKLFHLRFWKDGSPRLTAYELQGLINSRCFKEAEFMSCTTCHDAHGKHPEGMIHPIMKTDRACLQCHDETYQSSSHTKHREHVSCYACHMPNIVYGVMSIHPTHLIRNPDPTRTVRFNMPNACNLCHLEKSVNWAIRQFNEMWNYELETGDSLFELPEILRGFGMGDAEYRVILLEHARIHRLKGFEGVYAQALKDSFYIVSLFARMLVDTLYDGKLPEVSRDTILDKLIPLRNEEEFEYGE